MRALADEGEGAPALMAGGPSLDPGRALDGMTYVQIEVSNPEDPERCLSVRALVDTGSTDCELKGRLIDQLVAPRRDEVVEAFVNSLVHDREPSVRDEARTALEQLENPELLERVQTLVDEGLLG